MILRKYYLLLLLPIALAAHADDGSLDTIFGASAPSGYAQGFAGSATLGYTATTGNSQTSSLDAKTGLSYGMQKWYHVLSLEEIRSSESGATTAQSATAEAQSDYLLTQNNYLFGHLGYNRDEFSGIERRTSETFGYGRRLFHTKSQTLSAQLGAGARQERLQGGGTRNSAILQLGGTYAWQFSENSSFSEGVVAEAGTDNTRLESQTALTVKMIANLAVNISYTVKYNTNVPSDTKKTDTYTSVGLSYSF